MEMAKKFGGAKQKCLQRIRSRSICKPSNFQLDISSGLIFKWANPRRGQELERGAKMEIWPIEKMQKRRSTNQMCLGLNSKG